MSKGMYTITEAREGRHYPNPHRPQEELVVWHVKLGNAVAETPDGSFELHKKPGNVPQPGQTVEVERTQQGDFQGTPFVRIYLVSNFQQQPQSGAVGASGGQAPQGSGPGLSWKSQPYERGAEHPRNEARAIHTSAISAAPTYYELFRTEGVISQAVDKASMLNTLAGIITWLEASYGPVLDAVTAPQGASNGQAELTPAEIPQEVPVDMEGLAPTPTQQAAAGGDDLGF